MSDIQSPKNQDSFDESLLTAYLDNELSQQEKQEVESVIEASPKLQQLLAELSHIRRLVAKCKVDKPVLTRSLQHSEWATLPNPKTDRWYWKGGVGALAALAAGLLVYISLHHPVGPKQLSKSTTDVSEKAMDREEITALDSGSTKRSGTESNDFSQPSQASASSVSNSDRSTTRTRGPADRAASPSPKTAKSEPVTGGALPNVPLEASLPENAYSVKTAETKNRAKAKTDTAKTDSGFIVPEASEDEQVSVRFLYFLSRSAVVRNLNSLPADLREDSKIQSELVWTESKDWVLKFASQIPFSENGEELELGSDQLKEYLNQAQARSRHFRLAWSPESSEREDGYSKFDKESRVGLDHDTPKSVDAQSSSPKSIMPQEQIDGGLKRKVTGYEKSTGENDGVGMGMGGMGGMGAGGMGAGGMGAGGMGGMGAGGMGAGGMGSSRRATMGGQEKLSEELSSSVTKEGDVYLMIEVAELDWQKLKAEFELNQSNQETHAQVTEATNPTFYFEAANSAASSARGGRDGRWILEAIPPDTNSTFLKQSTQDVINLPQDRSTKLSKEATNQPSRTVLEAKTNFDRATDSDGKPAFRRFFFHLKKSPTNAGGSE